MHKAALAVLHANTPSVAVRGSADSPLLALRLLRHPDVPQARLLRTRSEADLLSRKTWVFGARPLRATPTAPLLPDATTVSSLDGQALERHTADGDTTLALNDSAGRLLWAQNAQGTRNWSLYEAAAEGGRLLATFEQPAGGMPRQRERMLHAKTTSAERDRNLVGSIIKQFDNAGYLHTRSQSLTDQVIETRRYLLQPEAQLPDWAGDSESELEPSALRMTACHDATGAVLATTNPADVTVLTAYDISGAISETRLHQGNAQAVAFNAVQRRADGAPLLQAAANGVIDTFTYSPTTQRLVRHKTSRPAGHPLGALMICDLHYHYDPVGNLQALDDRSVDPQWHHNQQVSGVREYAYDTLYRLVHATGRERAVTGGFRTAAFSAAGRRGGGVWSRYREQYSYDDGDNLTTLSHNGGAGVRSRKLVVTSQSNRALPDGLGLLPESGFLAGGLQKLLAAGRPLAWQADNQLREVCLVGRSDGEADDREHYHYADGSTRTRKITSLNTAGAWQKIITTYLQGLELRQRLLAGQPLPHKDVVITEIAGLRWVHDRLGDEIHLRYSFSDHLGSVGGETDRSGKLVTREEYAPFGETTGLDETASEADALIHRTWRYSGKERDATGLYYYGWRYYQPGLARWLSADPGGTVDGLNLYRMVRNNPVRNRDDRGLVGEDASAEPDFWAFLDPNEHWIRYAFAINLIYGSHALINTALPILDSLIHAGRAADRWRDVPRRVVADLRRQARTRLGAVGMISIAARITALTLTTISALRRYHSEDPVAGQRLITAASLMQFGTTYFPAFSESYGFYIHPESRRTRRPSEYTPDLSVADPEVLEMFERPPSTVSSASASTDLQLFERQHSTVDSASGAIELQQVSVSRSHSPSSPDISQPAPHIDSAHSSLSGTAIRGHSVGQVRSRSLSEERGPRQKRYSSQ